MGISWIKLNKKMKGKKVSVILPTYNEKDNIEELIRQVYHYTGKDLFEVIVVDDNSSDGTEQVIKKLQKGYNNLRLIVRTNERGLSSAIWRGIKESKGNVVMWLDCDLSHPPKVIPQLLENIPQYDVVIASRYVSGGKDKRLFMRVLASKLVNLLAYIFLGLKVKDLTSGFYAVKKEVFSRVKLITTGHAEYCIKFSYDSVKKGFKIKEVSYVFSDRKKGKSKTTSSLSNFLYYGYLCGKEIIKLSVGK
ncbi:polyprenol monophosphomannose synthase [Candidatus Woesearchaeota archaeon]|nr:polyprenol monophosphomannose synthase [Candidatus Woesearchaeota archaeon]